MKPRITFLTLGVVDDLERSLAFYCDGLRFPTKGIVGTEFEHGDVVFIDCEHGLKLALYSRDHLAYDATIPRTPPSPADFSIGHLVESQQAVDAVAEQAHHAGASIVKTPQAITLTSRTRTDTYGKLPGILTRSGLWDPQDKYRFPPFRGSKKACPLSKIEKSPVLHRNEVQGVFGGLVKIL